MDELISILTEIRDQLADLNNKIDALTGYGTDNISDICGKLDDVNSSLENVNSSLEDVNSGLSTIDMTLMMKD